MEFLVTNFGVFFKMFTNVVLNVGDMIEVYR